MRLPARAVGILVRLVASRRKAVTTGVSFGNHDLRPGALSIVD